MKTKFLYLSLMLFTVYVEIMYDESDALLFLAFEILLLASMFLLSFQLKRQLRISAAPGIPVVSKGQAIPLKVTLENTGWLPVSRITGLLVYENEYSYVSGDERIGFGLDGKKKVVIEREIPTGYCGRMCIRLEELRVYDYLGVFARQIKSKGKSYVNVLPDIYPMSVEVGMHTRNFPVDAEEYDSHRSGDDPSEIFQIREYRAGDSMQRIHWKMSAKADELMTKEYSQPVGCSVLLLFDLHHAQKQMIGPGEMDRMLETAASLSYSLMLVGCIHYASWFEESSAKVRRVCVKGEEQVYEMIDLLMGAFPYGEAFDLKEGYHARYPRGQYAVELRLDIGLKLWKDEEFYADFSEGELKDTLQQMLLEL